VNLLSVARLYGRAGRLTALFGGFRPGQEQLDQLAPGRLARGAAEGAATAADQERAITIAIERATEAKAVAEAQADAAAAALNGDPPEYRRALARLASPREPSPVARATLELPHGLVPCPDEAAPAPAAAAPARTQSPAAAAVARRGPGGHSALPFLVPIEILRTIILNENGA
jgi:hypothetical protein